MAAAAPSLRVLTVGNMYPPHHLGGAELAWYGAVRHLRERGHEVRVLTTDFRLADPDPAVDDGLDVHRELQWYWKDYDFPRLSLRERLALERHNAAVLAGHLDAFGSTVVSWWSMGGMSLSMIERVRRRAIPAVGVVHDEWMLYGPKVDAWLRACSRLGPARAAIEPLAGVPARLDLARAGTWLFVSEALRRHAVRRWRLRDTAVAHTGIDTSLFRPADEKPWRSRLLCLGRIDPRKGLATAIRALAMLPDASLAVVGSGDEAHLAELRRLTQELDLDGRVSFSQVGRTQIASAYAGADALLFPVLWEEPWGLVPLEAMSTGTPVIATGTGGSAEYLRDGENCLIFRPRDDPHALAEAVRRLATDARLRAGLREAGFATAAQYPESAFNEAVTRAVESAAG